MQSSACRIRPCLLLWCVPPCRGLRVVLSMHVRITVCSTTLKSIGNSKSAIWHLHSVHSTMTCTYPQTLSRYLTLMNGTPCMQVPPLLGAGEDAPGEEDEERHNFALAKDGAKIVAANKEARKPESVLDSDGDTFLRNDCRADKWLILELSQVAKVDTLKLSQVIASLNAGTVVRIEICRAGSSAESHTGGSS